MEWSLHSGRYPSPHSRGLYRPYALTTLLTHLGLAFDHRGLTQPHKEVPLVIYLLSLSAQKDRGGSTRRNVEHHLHLVLGLAVLDEI